MNSISKYVLRFAPIFAAIFILLAIFGGVDGVTTVVRKLILLFAGGISGEIFWLFFFKPVLGSMENTNEKFLGIAILRGLILLAFIMGAALGL